jgi:hypothetical protein
MIAWILSRLFPPRLPGKIRDWPEPTPYRTRQEEQGWAGNVQQHYRDGIDRHWSEHKLYGGTCHQWGIQLRNAEETMAAFERALTEQGYINTIHDCWEMPNEPLGDLQKLTLQGPPKK